MRLILTRHGETEENIAGIMQGHLPGKLSDSGIEQAKRLALRLKDEKIDYIFSSDLARSADTAKEIIKFHPNVPVRFVKELREKNLGEFQGKKKSELGFKEGQLAASFLEPKNGETSEDLYNRAKSFLDKVISEHRNDSVLFVGHNAINKAIIAVITGKKYNDIWSMENHNNTSVSIFEVNENMNHEIICFNCTNHL